METTWLMTIFAILMLMMFLLIAAWMCVEYGNKQATHAAEYETKYAKIEQIIDTYEVCELNFDWINRLFDHLYELKYKNPERTEVLYNQFREKYSYIIVKRKVEDVI